MARAKRHYIPGHVWHITHRCHKREFLLKFSRDRRRYLQWLYHARKRYALSLLNFDVTSNHVHLLVVDGGDRDVILNSMQLVAGRTGVDGRDLADLIDNLPLTDLAPFAKNFGETSARNSDPSTGNGSGVWPR